MEHPKIFTVAEACKIARISRAWIYKEWKDGRGPRKIKAGSRTLISSHALSEWMKSLEQNQREDI